MKTLLIFLMLGSSAFANEVKDTYQVKIETTIPGKAPTTETIDFADYVKHPQKKISRFYETKDGTYLNEFFPPRLMAHDGKTMIYMPVISGKMPDPKTGADLNNLEYGFDKMNDVVTVFQNDPTDPKAHLFSMKIQLLQKKKI